MNESIDKSDEKRNKIIEKIMDNIIFPEYKHIICGYDVKNDEVFNEPVVNVIFIGGYGTKLWPTTQGIQKMYRDILDEIWDTIYDYINIPVGVTMETTPKCDEQENIYLRESIDKSKNNKLKLVKNIIYDMFDNVINLEYDSKINEIMVYHNKKEKLEISEICDTINNFTNLNVVPWFEYDKNRIGKEPDFYLDVDDYDEQENIYLRESIDKSEDKKLKLVKNIIYDMFDNIIDLEYIDKRNEIMVYYDTQEELESSEICDTINKFTGLNVVPWYDYKKRTELKKDPDFYIDTERYEEELNENYSPAGKEIIPNEIVIHKSNPKFRDKIIEQGLKVRAGECYKIYAGYGTKCKPAIFATNSTNKRSWFDSTYDDDVWEIDTTMMPEIKWYKDRHYESSKKHIVTFQDIPKEAIKLIYEGSGKDGGIMESVDKSEDKKLKLVTKMIHEFFDDVSFIDIKKYENKPMIRVYFDNDEYAGNEETYFAEQIQDKIYEYTGIKLVPYWHNIQYNTDADFRLDAIKLKYDNEGNVINESEEKQPKYVNIIKNLIEPFKEEEDCVCEIRVTSEDDFYIIYLVFGTEELNDKFSSFLQRAEYTINLRNDVKNTIKDYLPIDNIYVGSISKPNCEWKPMNESTFFLRRVDTSLMEKEFFENLNIITDVYLDKYNNGVGFNFETFEDHAINYFIDNYYNDLTNYGENDYPYDEIYKFLSNHFHNKIKDKYDTFFGRNINESENKKQSLLKTIEKEGLYNFIEMSGLDISQISSVLKNMDNPKEVLKQYIRDFVLTHGNKWGDNSGTLSGYEIQLSDNKYVDDITVQDNDQIAVEILEFDQDEYGHTEQNDQYITTINNLTNDELLTIIDWMMETIKNGDWD
jgi:hypothetical protein